MAMTFLGQGLMAHSGGNHFPNHPRGIGRETPHTQ